MKDEKPKNVISLLDHIDRKEKKSKEARNKEIESKIVKEAEELNW